MFIINGFIGLETRDVEELQSVSESIFCHTMYEIRLFRGLLELTLKNCSNRQDALSVHQLNGEPPHREGELWDDHNACLMAKVSLESFLRDLDELTGNLQLDGQEEHYQPEIAAHHATPCNVAGASSAWIN